MPGCCRDRNVYLISIIKPFKLLSFTTAKGESESRCRRLIFTLDIITDAKCTQAGPIIFLPSLLGPGFNYITILRGIFSCYKADTRISFSVYMAACIAYYPKFYCTK